MTLVGEHPQPERRIFCNRTLNMRSIRAIGFDMDYTLIHYQTQEWEGRAYEYVRGKLAADGWPVGPLRFDPTLVMRGLVLDRELGNIVKADRFGFVRRACHGTRMLDFEEQRRVYAGVLVDLGEQRWTFLNTFFSLSEACLYAQLVDLLDAGRLDGLMSYEAIQRKVRALLDETHMEGELKREIVEAPDRFVVADPELPLTLLDLKNAGKVLLLITNSEWGYTRAMMSHALDAHLPGSMTWRDVFDVVVVSARKPSFFTGRAPMFEVLDDSALLRPMEGKIQRGGAYLGGNAAVLEEHLGLSGHELLYVGDHIFADVHVSKSLLRWRTALVIRELEEELRELEAFKPRQTELTKKMQDKEKWEHEAAHLRLLLQRIEGGYGPRDPRGGKRIRNRLQVLRRKLLELDEQIGPIAKDAVELVNPRWGLLMRAGNDKSHLARQVERYADVYTSRVSNFLLHTPFFYLRSPRGSLPHDSGPSGGA